MKVERWVITGECGLYIGQWQTRADAIKKHTSDIMSGRQGIPVLSEFGSLNSDHRRAWKICKRRGDRAVRATISF